jgi:serine protease Do
MLTTMTADLSAALGVPATKGALIRQIHLEGPAARAGLRTGDVVTRFGDTPVATVSDVYAALRQVEPGDTVTVEVNRGGDTVRVQVTLGTLGSD